MTTDADLPALPEPLVPGTDRHLRLLMARHNLNMVVGDDYANVIGLARDAFDSGRRAAIAAERERAGSVDARVVPAPHPAPSVAVPTDVLRASAERPRCSLGCVTECRARKHGCPSECLALPWQPTAAPPQLSQLRAALDSQAAELEKLRAANANLKTVMVAAAEEIAAHWDAHCDAEGYGPQNLMRRLEEGIPSEYGYTAGRFADLQAELAALRAELLIRRKSGSASERLHNLCEGIAADADGSEWSREEWERIDAENLALRKELAALRASAASVQADQRAELDRLRERLADAMRNAARYQAAKVNGEHNLAICEYDGEEWVALDRRMVDSKVDAALAAKGDGTQGEQR